MEYRILEAMHYDSMATGDHAQAIVTAKEMVLLSTVAQVPEIEERARRYSRSTVALAGRYHENLTERFKILQHLTPADDAYLREKKGLVTAQFNLGDLDGVWATTQQEPELPIHATVIQAFRGIFSAEDAGDSAVLGDKVIGWMPEVFRRWHPRPAAYLALCPAPVAELLLAAEAILRCHKKAEAYGVILPPVTAFNEFQRRFGQPPDRSSLSSNARFQYGKLAVQRGDLRYWRPVVIAAQLITALTEARTPAHQHMADRLTAEFGLLPGHLPKQFA